MVLYLVIRNLNILVYFIGKYTNLRIMLIIYSSIKYK